VCGGVDKSFFAVDFPDHLSDLSVFVGHGCDSRRRFGESSGGKSRFRFAKDANVWVAAAGRGIVVRAADSGVPRLTEIPSSFTTKPATALSAG